MYRNEHAVGKAINDLISEGKIRRNEVWITSKIHPKNQGYENALKSIHESLDAMKLDYIDCMLIHWPGTQKLKLSDSLNINNRIGTLKALKECVKNGLLRTIGVSNFMKKHLTPEFLESISVNQIEFHPLQNTQEMIELLEICKNNNIKVQAYSPLGQGVLLRDETVIDISLIAKCTPYLLF